MPANLITDDLVLHQGEVIDGKYEIISRIGQGSMGVVYKARSLSLHREVAIKMLTQIDADTLGCFRREAATLAKIRHRTIVRADDFGDAGKYGPYLVFAYHAGETLDLVAKRRLPIREVVDLTLAICSGVSACHIYSIIHRDLKPSNVIVTNESLWQDRVKILDFGLALPFDSPIVTVQQTRMSNLGQVEGTRGYIAPELLRHEDPTPHCDQYAIAALLYLLLTGRAPFYAKDGVERVTAILRGEYVPLVVLRPDTSETLQASVSRGMRIDPKLRFASVNQFALELVPEASEKLQKSFTHYFLDGMRHVERRLIEPVSGYRPIDSPQRRSSDFVIKVAGPLVDPSAFPHIVPSVSEQVTAPLAKAPAPAAPSPEPSPAARSSASLPEPVPISRTTPAPSDDDRVPCEPVGGALLHRRRVRRHDTEVRVMFVFVCGAAFGVLVTIAAFLSFVCYRSQGCACISTPEQPALVLPWSGGNAPR